MASAGSAVGEMELCSQAGPDRRGGVPRPDRQVYPGTVLSLGTATARMIATACSAAAATSHSGRGQRRTSSHRWEELPCSSLARKITRPVRGL